MKKLPKTDDELREGWRKGIGQRGCAYIRGLWGLPRRPDPKEDSVVIYAYRLGRKDRAARNKAERRAS